MKPRWPLLIPFVLAGCTDETPNTHRACECGTPHRSDGALPPPAVDGSGSRPDPGLFPDAGAPLDSARPAPPGAKPIMFAAGHYPKLKAQLAGLGPFIVYGWAADPALSMYSQQLGLLSQIQDPGVTKMVMFSSLKTAKAKLSDAGQLGQLKGAGVTALGYNTEGDKTPAGEMSSLTQAVSQFAQLAQKSGLQAIWGPIRATAEKTSDASYSQMIAAGLDGVGLQEQKWIESACVPQRAGAVKALSARLKKLSPGFAVQVQIMPSRCLAGDAYAAKKCGTQGPKFHHCQAFGDQIAPAVDSLAIWASSPADNANLVPLIRALRHK
jgi:hypothetical protein